MITMMKVSRIVCTYATLLLLAPIQGGTSLPATKRAEPTTKPAKLGKYYGFGPMEILKLQWKLSRPIVVDINADGLNDLIVANNRKARIDLLLQKRDFEPDKNLPLEIIDDDVNDRFGREKTWRFKRVAYDLDVAATSLVVADLNADGLPDLAFYAKDGLRVVLQDKPKLAETAPADPEASQIHPREPTWSTARKFDIREGLSNEKALTSGDLNGDALEDLVLLSSDGTFVIMQKEDGTLRSPRKYHCGGRQPREVYVADVDGDKRMDLVIRTAEREFPVRVRYQTTQGKLGPELRYPLPIPRALELVTLTEDAASCFLSISRLSGRVTLSGLAKDASLQEHPVYTYPLPASDAPDKRDIAIGDVNGDGLTDVIVSDPSRAEFLLFRASQISGLSTPKRFPGLTNMSKLVAADLDGSGKDSIVALSVTEKIIGITRMTNGRLSFPEAVSITDEPQAMDVTDVDGDGKADLVYVARNKKDEKYYLRSLLGLGRKNCTVGPEIELTELKDKPLDIRTGDIDHDGRTDVMIVRPYSPLLLVRQPEAGKFAQVTRTDIHGGLVANVQPTALSLGALGEKGAMAALLAKQNFARAVVFDSEKGWEVVDQYQAASRRSNLSAAAACSLGDGDDLAIVTYDSARGKLGILRKEADGTYGTDREVKVGSISVRRILAGNFGGDSPASILLCGTRKLILVPTQRSTHLLRKLASFEPDITDARYGAVATGDINSDGLPEIVLVDQRRHHVEILTFDSKGVLVSGSKFKVFEAPRGTAGDRYDRGGRRDGEPRAVCIGDVTGDGKNDLVLLVHDRIIIYPQE